MIYQVQCNIETGERAYYPIAGEANITTCNRVMAETSRWHTKPFLHRRASFQKARVWPPAEVVSPRLQSHLAPPLINLPAYVWTFRRRVYSCPASPGVSRVSPAQKDRCRSSVFHHCRQVIEWITGHTRGYIYPSLVSFPSLSTIRSASTHRLETIRPNY